MLDGGSNRLDDVSETAGTAEMFLLSAKEPNERTTTRIRNTNIAY